MRETAHRRTRLLLLGLLGVLTATGGAVLFDRPAEPGPPLIASPILVVPVRLTQDPEPPVYAVPPEPPPPMVVETATRAPKPVARPAKPKPVRPSPPPAPPPPPPAPPAAEPPPPVFNLCDYFRYWLPRLCRDR
ncbi:MULTISPECIES: hypothetical protein [unclassified Crossiella]|uniref:hypothetical protein n=1 Tax=unclassified Crossiella TaxID=2620835 RepID=UPI001FFEBA51|nr:MULTISPECIES: hypothetical protein [unclassified Crossiella]MCK2241377.1 hypothetical protein [Crossiella sp. S99.2]MCK2253479.1 hypothetical protein [Crossiella sp. S99.1]